MARKKNAQRVKSLTTVIASQPASHSSPAMRSSSPASTSRSSSPAPAPSAERATTESDATSLEISSFIDRESVREIASGVHSATTSTDADEVCARPEVIKLELALRPTYVMTTAEGTMRIEVLEEVVEDLKLELDGYRAASRELAMDLEKMERALERSREALERELSEGRRNAIEDATRALVERLEKAERAIEREREDGERGRMAMKKLKELERELERRMLDRDDAFETKWKTRVDEANANQEAFRNKLAILEADCVEVKMSEELARDELRRVRSELERAVAALANAKAATPSPARLGDVHAGVLETTGDVIDDSDSAREASELTSRLGGFNVGAEAPNAKPRRGWFSFIAGSDRAEPYVAKNANSEAI